MGVVEERADTRHHLLDPVIVAGPWVAAVAALAVALRSRRR